jgi:capsular exopolysaccharide synthesis family protein
MTTTPSSHVYRANGGELALRPPPQDLPQDEPVEARRYVDAFRRSWPLILLIVVPLTILVFVVSAMFPKTYSSSAKLVLDTTANPLEASDAASVQRRLSTIQVLLTTRDVFARAARRLPGETAASLAGKVSSSVDTDANVITLAATDSTARGAARIANAVASTFLAEQRVIQQQQLARERASLLQALDKLRGTPGARAQRVAIQNQLAQLNVSAASSRPELALAERARPSSRPASPHPVRNAFFGLFAALFVAALVVLGRAQFAPRLSGSREVRRLLDVPVLAEVPLGRRSSFARGPRTLSGAEYEAYQTLHAALKMQLPPTQQQIVLVTSALHGEGKTEVTAGLGLALSQAGLRTWLVSADMRWPRLHELFDVDQSPGLAEVLAGARIYHDGVPDQLAPDHPIQFRADSGRGSLHVLASGSKPRDPAKLLASDALDTFFDQIKRSDYDYVLLDGPPLIGLVDSQVLAQRVDGVILVTRPEKLMPANVIDMRDLLARLQVDPLGVVVVGSHVTPSAYVRS